MKSNINIKEIVCDHRFWMLVCYIIAIAILACFHEPWGDEIQAWYLAVVHNVPGLFERMAIEGHFMLWHMLLYPFAKMGMSCTVGLPLVSSILMAIAAWLLIYKSPFNTLTKVLLLLGYPMLYYFPVVSRCYALIPPILFYLAIVYPQRMQRPIAYGIAIGLLFNTHMYMQGMTIILMACWGIEIIKTARSKNGMPEDVKLKFLYIGYAIALVCGLFALSQILGNFFQEEYSPAFAHREVLGRVAEKYYQSWMSSVAKPSLYFAKHGMMVVYGLIMYLLLAAFGIFSVWVLKNRKQPLLIGIFAIVYQILFSMFIYPTDWQRNYLPLLIMLTCFWMSRGYVRRVAIWATVLLLGNLYAEVTAIHKDITSLYEDYIEYRRILEVDNNPNTYISNYSYIIKLMRYSFGPDTIANSKRFDSDNHLYEMLRKDNPDHFVLITDCTNDYSAEPRQKVCQMLDSIKAKGYVCTDSTTNLTFLNSAYRIQRYCFDKQNRQASTPADP